LIAAAREEISASGIFKSGRFFGLAFVLELAEFSHFLFAAAGQAGFVEMQILELLFVDEHGVHFDHDGAIGRGVVWEERVEFEAAFGEQGHFEAGDASQTPAGVGNGLHESAFFGADGLELFFVGEDVGLVAGGVVRRQEDGMASEAGFDGVERDGGFASLCFWAAGFLGVLAIGFETGSGDGLGHCGGWFERKDFGSDDRLGGFASQIILFALSSAAFGTIHDFCS
jgi:hypothetical protein